MRSRAQNPRVIGALLVIVGLLAGVIAFALNTSAQAQIATDFNLSVTDGGLPAAGGSSDVVVAITPGQSAIAAIGATVAYDETLVAPTACVALVGLGACNLETPGVVNVQTVDAAGWAAPTDLFRLTFTSIALEDAAPLAIAVTEAYDVGGTLIAGETGDGEIIFRIKGDVNCTNTLTIADALFIAQYVVGNRTAVASCPLVDPITEIYAEYADISGEGTITTTDALLVARCTVGNYDCEA